MRVSLYTKSKSSAFRGKNRALGHLELVLQIVVSHHMSAGPEPRALEKTAIALNHGAISPVPMTKGIIIFCYSGDTDN